MSSSSICEQKSRRHERTNKDAPETLVFQKYRNLVNVTSVTKDGDGCKIAFTLDFDYAGRMGGMALKLGFQGLASRMVTWRTFCR